MTSLQIGFSFLSRNILFLLCLLLSQASFAQVTLPIVDMGRLSVGQYWIWVYYTQGQFDQPYSYEKYQVVQMNGSKATFILSSRFSENEPFQERQKFIVDLEKCHKAYAQVNSPRGWSLESFYWSGNTWVSLGYHQDTAIFEEKFNCSPHLYQNHRKYETKFKFIEHPRLGRLETFAHLYSNDSNNRNGARSWYIISHPQLRATTVLKEFNPGTAHFYRMRLEHWGVERL